MGAPSVDLVISKGKTFEFALRYSAGTLVSREIQGIPSMVPVRLTVPSHGMPDDWPFRIICVKRPYELNGDYISTVVDEDTIELNGVVGQCWRGRWTHDGVIQYMPPSDLSGWAARAMLRRNIQDPDPILTFSTEPGSDGDIHIDPEESTFTLMLGDEASGNLPVINGVWDAEAIDPLGQVYELVGISKFYITDEVTR